MIGRRTFERASGDGRLTIASAKTTIPPRTRNPASPRIHQVGRPTAARRAARVTLRVVVIAAAPAVRNRRPSRSRARRGGRWRGTAVGQDLELGERLLDELDLGTVPGEVAVAERLLG